jgi:hypothetical protein
LGRVVGPGLQQEEAPRRRAPFGVPAVAVALVATVPVWLFDRLEGALGDLMPEGPGVLMAIVGAFALVWFVAGSAILARFSARPDREGLLAGALVALLMLVLLLGDLDLQWQIVAIVWVLFGSLAVGCGAVAGLIGARLQRGPTRSAGRAAAIVAIACAAAILFASQFFFGGPSGSVGLFVLVVVAGLGGTGVWWLMRSRQAGSKS